MLHMSRLGLENYIFIIMIIVVIINILSLVKSSDIATHNLVEGSTSLTKCNQESDSDSKILQ